MNALLTLAFVATLASAAAAQTKLGLDNPTVPVAPASAKQPTDAVLDSTGIPGAKDAAPEDSPVSAQHVGSAIKQGTTVSMQLSGSVDSGSNKNGDAVHGKLTAPVRTTAGVLLPAGTAVAATVVSAAKAGTVQSAGILSIQLTRVGSVPVVTDVADFNGQEGHKDVADSAPQKGTEAIAQAGAMLQFHVLENGKVPGIVPGATLQNTSGGKGGSKAGGPAALPSAGQPNVRAWREPDADQWWVGASADDSSGDRSGPLTPPRGVDPKIFILLGLDTNRDTAKVESFLVQLLYLRGWALR